MCVRMCVRIHYCAFDPHGDAVLSGSTHYCMDALIFCGLACESDWILLLSVALSRCPIRLYMHG
jgi:hypothetical protein